VELTRPAAIVLAGFAVDGVVGGICAEPDHLMNLRATSSGSGTGS